MPSTDSENLERSSMDRLFIAGITVGLGGLAVIFGNEVLSHIIHTPDIIKQGVKDLGAIALFTVVGATYVGGEEGGR